MLLESETCHIQYRSSHVASGVCTHTFFFRKFNLKQKEGIVADKALDRLRKPTLLTLYFLVWGPSFVPGTCLPHLFSLAIQHGEREESQSKDEYSTLP